MGIDRHRQAGWRLMKYGGGQCLARRVSPNLMEDMSK